MQYLILIETADKCEPLLPTAILLLAFLSTFYICNAQQSWTAAIKPQLFPLVPKIYEIHSRFLVHSFIHVTAYIQICNILSAKYTIFCLWLSIRAFFSIFWAFFLHSEGERTHYHLSFPEVPLITSAQLDCQEPLPVSTTFKQPKKNLKGHLGVTPLVEFGTIWRFGSNYFHIGAIKKEYSHFHIINTSPNNLRDLCVCIYAHIEKKKTKHRMAALLYQFSGLFF